AIIFTVCWYGTTKSAVPANANIGGITVLKYVAGLYSFTLSGTSLGACCLNICPSKDSDVPVSGYLGVTPLSSNCSENLSNSYGPYKDIIAFTFSDSLAASPKS